MRQTNERLRAIEARLGRETEIWFATVRADGRPHLVPLWFVWLDGKAFVATGTSSQKWINLLSNQQVSLSLPDANNVIIIEGHAHATDRATQDVLAEYFSNKYAWDFRFDDEQDYRLIVVTPTKMLAWGDGYDETQGVRVL